MVSKFQSQDYFDFSGLRKKIWTQKKILNREKKSSDHCLTIMKKSAKIFLSLVFFVCFCESRVLATQRTFFFDVCFCQVGALMTPIPDGVFCFFSSLYYDTGVRGVEALKDF